MSFILKNSYLSEANENEVFRAIREKHGGMYWWHACQEHLERRSHSRSRRSLQDPPQVQDKVESSEVSVL